MGKKDYFGYAGKVLRINLTNYKVWNESLFNYRIEEFIGGRGLNQWILFNELKSWMSPFDPNNILILGCGPLVGTNVPCGTRLSIDSKSPITGGVGSGSVCGNFAQELKYAGYDVIIIQGKSRFPVYIWIKDDDVQIKEGKNLWGKNTWETEEIIKNELGCEDFEILCIGPAGENLVKYACIITDHDRAVGRCGLGSVMGSKNLKAIVVKGNKKLRIKNIKEFLEIKNNIIERLEKSERARSLRECGTYGRAILLNKLSLFPYKNFKDDAWGNNKLKKVLYEFNNKKIGVKTYRSCPLNCIQLHKYIDDNSKEIISGGLKFNSLWNFGSRLDIDNAETIIQINDLCNQMGLDIDSTSSTIAWAIEIYEKGIISNKDTDGINLKWGKKEEIINLIKKISKREGFGNVLAEGSYKASTVIKKGSEYFSINIKGQDSIEPLRAAKGWALGCCVSTRGGTHTRGANLIELLYNEINGYNSYKIWGIKKLEEPKSYQNKAKLVVYYERLQAILDSLGICLFSSNWWSPDLLGPEEYAKIYYTVTGINIDGKKIMEKGEKIVNIEKAFNTIHGGFSKKDDYPPLRFMKERIHSGKYKGEIINKRKWRKLLEEYYKLHGWNKETGLQKSYTLKKLGLDKLINEIKECNSQY